MKKTAIIALVVLLIPAALMAQDTNKPVKVGFINIQRLTLESTIGKASQTKVEDFVRQRMAELQKIDSELKEAAAALEQQRTIITADAFTQRKNALEQRALQFEQDRKDADTQLQQIQAEESRKFINAAGPILESLGTELGLTMLVDSTADRNPWLIWYDKSVDITDMAIQRLNAATAGK